MQIFTEVIKNLKLKIERSALILSVAKDPIKPTEQGSTGFIASL